LGATALLVFGVLAAALSGCQKDREHGALVVSVSGNKPGVNCTGAGCACSPEGATAPCGQTEAVKGDDVVCALGTRSCTGGVWGACDVKEHITKYAPRTGSNHLLNLAESPVPCGDKCDPYCSVYVDTPPGIDPGPDLMLQGGTLTLPGREGGGSCSDVVITPTSGRITITSLRPLVADPPSIGFSATCGAGGPAIVPSWVVRAADSDVARIDASGVLRVVSGVAKSVQVTGATAAGSASATVDIVVGIDQVDAECDGTADLFASAPSGNDPGRTLYPYSVPARPVVFPLELGGPLVQWSTGGVDADCVKVTLDFPRGAATPSFHWSRVFAPASLSDPKIIDRTQPAAPIPDDVWRGFARAASGQSADIVVQRHAAGAPTPLAPLPPIPVRFASDAIRGTAFFTQYMRRFRDDRDSPDTDICSSNENGNQPDLDITDPRYRTDAASGCANGDCSANSAPVCPVGNCTQAVSSRTQVATLQALDLANPAQGLTSPFGTGSGTRCTACHSISADGSTLVASDYALSGLQTIAKLDSVNGRAHATPIADAPTYSWSSSRGDSILPEREQSKGLSFAALTPDGHYVLQGPNYWGNTDYDLHLGDGALQNAAYPAGGKRYFLLDVSHYRKNVRLATAGALPPHGAANGVLTGSSNGVLTIDGSGVAVGDAILVKDEPVASENGIYTVEVSSSARPFRLVRRTDNGGVAPLAFGDKFRVERGLSNGGKYFHIAAPSAAIQLGVTPITFALYTTVMAATSGPLPASSLIDWDDDGILDITGEGVFDASLVDDVPVASGLSILVKDEVGARVSRNGIYELVDFEGDPWVLRRRSEADADPELVAGARVRVNQGTRFGGKTFVLSGPNPNIGSSAIAFVADDALDEGTKYDRGGVASTLPTMMFPSFAPDGSSLVYVNGDADTAGTSAAPSGWRRGLSLLSFNQNNGALPFSNKRRVLSTFNANQPGAVLKWPFFEPDSRSVVYQEGSPDEFCSMEAYEGRCTGPDCSASTEGYEIDSEIERACFKWCGPGEYGHGNGAPTTRGYWPGRLQAVSTDSAQKAELAFLNGGLGSQDALAFAADGGKAYQPNVLPFAAGGYRWVIFTSTRAYGNQLNAVGTHFTCSAPLLWVAALDDAPAGTTDRSYPAFLLPGQNLRSIWADNTTLPYGRHYVNERGVLVPNACKTEHASCSADAECCGGTGMNPSMQCRLNTMTDPPSHTCEAASSCRATGDACSDDGGCCSGLCVEDVCSTGPRFTAALYTRVFASKCMPGYKVRWGSFEWHANAPSSSHIDFRVAVSDSPNSFDGNLLIGRADTNNINVPPDPLQRVDVGALLRDAEIGSAAYLRVSMEFYPSQDGFTAPVLYDWDQRYDCLAAE
jgi:hypothetical protein